MRRYSFRDDSVVLVAPAPPQGVDYGLFHTDDSGLEPAIGLELRGGDLKISPATADLARDDEKTACGTCTRPWQEDDLLCALHILQCMASGPENFVSALAYLGFRDTGVSAGCAKTGFHRLFEFAFTHNGGSALLRLFADPAEMTVREYHALLPDGNLVSMPAGHRGLVLAVCRAYALATGTAAPECLDLSDHAEIAGAVDSAFDLRNFPPLSADLGERADAARLALGHGDGCDFIRRYARAKFAVARGLSARRKLNLNLIITLAALLLSALILAWVFLL